MSCWVVPAIAAEVWGIPVIQVLERIRKGILPTKSELGFTLVDVAPGSPVMGKSAPAPAVHGPTFVYADENSVRLDWHEPRRLTSRLRRPPARQLAAAA